ncbi:MAG: hypothetical protein LAN84_00370 [Acidobacteriia bacterium]|nr:hypothetical protein [Terriglobia bacterium]
MPNIIVSLTQEMARVRALLPSLGPNRSREADTALQCAAWYMAHNSLEGMAESLSYLREFTAEPKK